MAKFTGLEIAVIGLAGRFPKADNIEQYWENLQNGRNCISYFSDKEAIEEGESEALVNDPSYIKSSAFIESKKYFDSAFFNYRPDEAELMDPQTRVYHECCWEALEDCGYSNKDHNEKIGIFAAGTSNFPWLVYSTFKNQQHLVDDFTVSYLRDITFLSSQISYLFNLKRTCNFYTNCMFFISCCHTRSLQ